MSEESVIVKLIKLGATQEKKIFDSYDSALNYAKKKVEQDGYKAIIFRLVDNKVWARTTFYPNESC